MNCTECLGRSCGTIGQKHCAEQRRIDDVETVECPYCGEIVPCDDENICPECGETLDSYTAEDAAYDKADAEYHDLRDNGLI
jgi:predicted amidophosphoribosyltransferase